MQAEARLVKAFTQDPQEGNPAGVVLDASPLNREQMQDIAAKLGFSESAFVSNSELADYRLRFFTPIEEVDLCAHAVIASFYLIAQREFANSDQDVIDFTQETNAGVLAVKCYRDGLVVMKQTGPVIDDYAHDREGIAQLLGLTADDLSDLPITTISTGKPKIMIPVKSLEALNKIVPDLEGMVQYSIESNSNGYYAFTTETLGDEEDVTTRQFNPRSGINEDPATGIAAGPLAIYMQNNGLTDKKRIVVAQGANMSKPAKIYVSTENGVEVGGYAVEYGQKTFEV
jgi:PhzF family phenazine biosynthesis protein